MHDHSPSLGSGGIISLWEEREGKGERKRRGGKRREGKEEEERERKRRGGKRNEEGREKKRREHVTNSEILYM